MRKSCVAIALAAAVAGGCGSDDENSSEGSGAQTAEKPAKVVDVDKDPRAITCRDLADKVASARLSRTASFALADETLERNPKLSRTSNRNLLAQRIFAGMVELCAKEDASYRPADAAVQGVVGGRYELNPPDEKYVGD